MSNLRRQCPLVAVTIGTLIVGVTAATAQPPSVPSTTDGQSAPAVVGAEEVRERLWRQRSAELRLELDSETWTVVDVSPFLVIGNESATEVRRRATTTVAWARDQLVRHYFPQSPPHPIEIWLLRDAESYQQTCRERFHIQPSTPFGFYSAPHHALLMNIATGSGTLVHEMVHPYMAANFPRCPAWFNEGLASLYEQCCEREGRIYGLPNWRLRRLQSSIERGAALPFTQLCQLSDGEFYDDRSGLHYAQARYLCLYLQERRQLSSFYARFRHDVDQDPTGLRTLTDVIQQADWEADWRRFVMSLSETPPSGQQ